MPLTDRPTEHNYEDHACDCDQCLNVNSASTEAEYLSSLRTFEVQVAIDHLLGERFSLSTESVPVNPVTPTITYMPTEVTATSNNDGNQRPSSVRPRRTRCRICHTLRARRHITVLPQTLRVYDRGNHTEYPADRARVCIAHVDRGEVRRCGMHADSAVTDILENSDWVAPEGTCGNWFNAYDPCTIRSSNIGIQPDTFEGDTRLVICNDCRDRHNASFSCEACGINYIPNEEDVALRSSRRRGVCASCAPHYIICADCNRLRSTRGLQHVNSHGRQICASCNENYFNCWTCNTRYSNRNQGIRGYCREHSPSLDSEDFPWSDQIDNRCVDREMKPFYGNTSRLKRTTTRRRFGVELEFSRSSSIAAAMLCDKFGWGGKPDGTSGVVQEFVSPPMFGDDGIENVEQFCQRATKCALQVDRNCGYHLHVDLSGERKMALSRIACAYQTFLPLWRCFVPPSRRTNRYCNADEGNGTPAQIAEGTIKPFELDRSRYSAINWQSYMKHRTVENRLHTGSANPEKVSSWILANLGFVEWSSKLPFATILQYWKAPVTDQLSVLKSAGVWDDKLVNYYVARARKFGVDLVDGAPLRQEDVPTTPDDPRWLWNDEDYRRTRRWLGLGVADDCTVGELVDAWRVGVLIRQPTNSRSNFSQEIGVQTIRGYSEDMYEPDP